MKKKLLITLLLCSVFITIEAQIPQNATPITFTLEYVASGPLLPSAPKNPIDPPAVSIYGNILYFIGSHSECVLTLTDQDDKVVYVTNVQTIDTLIALPTSLFGTFTIRLYVSLYCFAGEITI